MPGLKKRLSHIGEYLLARAACAVLRVLPRGTALRFGERLGVLAWERYRLRRREVLDSLARSIPGKTPEALEKIGAAAYRNLGRWFVEMFLAPSLPTSWMRENIDLEGINVLDAALEQRTGVVNVTFHYGNWELMGAYVARLGYPLDVIARGQTNPLFHRWVTRMRESSGMRLIPVGRPGKLIARSLREGRVVCFLADQDAHALGVFVEFMGRPASTPKGPALYAFKHGCPVVFTLMLPRPDGKWKVVFESVPRPETTDRDEFVREMTAWYTRRLEEYVRANPEHWFWPHRRWKTAPPPGWG